MCGIVGARHDWLVSQGLDPAIVMRDAVASLAWRGPDGQAVERAGAWWLGCARLAIGPARSRQPVVRRGGRFVGVMNGAITNARELWTRLVPRVERRAALPNDAWLPVLAVERGDATLLRSLRGHHAYAVADAHTGELVFARDQFGEKPFHCLVERRDGAPQLVAFASTPVALQHLGTPITVSPRRLTEWFRFGWSEALDQRFARRRKLAVMTSKEPSVARGDGRTWYQPWGTLANAPFSTRGPVAPTVREALVASVARCADAAVPVALSLSGGLDSSCVALALASAGRRVPCYQLRAAGAAAAERNAAAAVAARTGCELRTVDAGRDVLDALPFLTACAGQPLGDPSILAVHAVARAAAADGVRVLLGGEGADELFLGYRRYHALAHLPRARWLRPLAPRWSMHYPARWLRAVAAADPVTALLAVTPPAFADAVLAPELAQRRCWRDERRAGTHWSDGLASMRLRDLHGYLRCDLLPKVDIACMAAGVEARAPYLEGDCVELAWHCVTPGKGPLREAFAADLPPEVLRLPKTGFALPLDRWFRGELPWLDLLREPTTCQRPHLRPGGIAAAIDRHRSGRTDLGHGLYLLVAWELFLRSLDRGSATRPGLADRVRTDARGAT
jgi:asparagine synthase (glutamine-hydrolysing)